MTGVHEAPCRPTFSAAWGSPLPSGAASVAQKHAINRSFKEVPYLFPVFKILPHRKAHIFFERFLNFVLICKSPVLWSCFGV